MKGRLRIPINQRRTYKQFHFYGSSLPEMATEIKHVVFPEKMPTFTSCDYNPFPNGLAKLVMTARNDERTVTVQIEQTKSPEPLPPGGMEEAAQAAWVEQRARRDRPRRHQPRPDIPEWNAKLSMIRRYYNKNFRPRNLKPTARTSFQMFKDNPTMQEAFALIDSGLKQGFPAPRSLVYHAAYLALQEYPARAITEAMERFNDEDEPVRRDIERKMELLYQELVQLMVKLIAGEV